MAIKPPTGQNTQFVDKRILQQAMVELNARIGFIPDTAVTPEKVRAMMRADGIRPEENEFSREILRMRYEEEE